jgi:asparagine synthase (glutamine-hydrolysing)
MKPLYYYNDGGRFLFASELKAIVSDRSVPRDIDVSALKDFLVYRYIPSPKSVWKGIKKLPPAHYLKYTAATKKLELREYWKLKTRENQPTLKEATDKVNDLLVNAMQEHLVSDVPIGLFLSGGMDSNGLAVYAHHLDYPLSSYSIGFSNWHLSEHEYAKAIAGHLHLQHHEEILDNSSIDLTEKLVYFFDEPFAASSMIPGYIISGTAARKVKVVLGGDGGDELFGGYEWYSKLFQNTDNGHSLFGNMKRFFGRDDKVLQSFKKYSSWGLANKASVLRVFSRDESAAFEKDPFWYFNQYDDPSKSVVKNAQFIDTHTFLPEACNTRADRCGMAHSIEVRVPYQDHELFEYVMSLKESVYFWPETKKKLLNANITSYLPKGVLDRPKKGFSSPLKRYVDVPRFKEEIMNGELIKADWISRDGLKDVLNLNEPVVVWSLYLLDRWYKMWR